MPKFTLEEKRLETLRRQLSGKKLNYSPSKPSTPKDDHSSYSLTQEGLVNTKTPYSQPSDTGVAYLKNDLLKIFSLSMLAIAAEIILYFLTNHHLVNLHL